MIKKEGSQWFLLLGLVLGFVQSLLVPTAVVHQLPGEHIALEGWVSGVRVMAWFEK